MRYKGRPSEETLGRNFPHTVEIVVPPNGLGGSSTRCTAFCAALNMLAGADGARASGISPAGCLHIPRTRRRSLKALAARSSSDSPPSADTTMQGPYLVGLAHWVAPRDPPQSPHNIISQIKSPGMSGFRFNAARDSQAVAAMLRFLHQLSRPKAHGNWRRSGS